MKSNKGFTLIEVLIASLILFSSIAVVAELFTSSRFTSSKVSESALFFQVGRVGIPIIKTSVMRTLVNREQPHSIDGIEVINGVNLKWVATREKRYFPPKPIDEAVVNTQRFALYRVDVEMFLNNKVRAFSIKVNVWQ